MKLKYVGESFGVFSLTNGKIYDAIYDDGFYRVIDDSNEDYLYSMDNPAPLDGSSPGGKWVVIDPETPEDVKQRFAQLEAEYNELKRKLGMDD